MPFAPRVFEVAYELFLLGIHRDGRLALIELRLHTGVDVLELGVAVGVHHLKQPLKKWQAVTPPRVKISVGAPGDRQGVGGASPPR
jgi:hypothetical protein